MRRAAGTAVLRVVLDAAASAPAHDITSHAVRELVRIQAQPGTATPPPNGCQLSFTVRGQHSSAASSPPVATN